MCRCFCENLLQTKTLIIYYRLQYMKIVNTIFSFFLLLLSYFIFLSLLQPVSQIILNVKIHLAFLAAVLILFALCVFPSLCFIKRFSFVAFGQSACSWLHVYRPIRKVLTHEKWSTDGRQTHMKTTDHTMPDIVLTLTNIFPFVWDVTAESNTK